VPIEYDLSSLGETFGSPSRARWRNAISAARVLTRFGNHKGANNHKDKSVVSSDDEEDDEGGRWVDVVACDAIHGQRQLAPPSPDDLVPRHGLAGFVATGLTRPTMTTPLLPSSPLSFSDAIKKAKVADAATAEAEKVRDEGGQQAQATAL